MLGSYLVFKKNMPPKFKKFGIYFKCQDKKRQETIFVVVRRDWQGRRENIGGIDSTGF
jgi:hypothetical protein